MKRYILLIIPIALLAVGCGAPASSIPASSAPSNSTANTAVNSGSGNAIASNSTNSTSAPTQGQNGTIQLITFDDSKNDGIIVDVPKGWSKAPITGGDFGGWKFVNPNDPNEEEDIVNSGCVGCYEPNGVPDPKAPIPEANAQNVFVFNHGLSAGYSFTKTGNPYPGNGVLTVSNDNNGYGDVEVILPESDHAVASQILNSFQLTL